MMVYDGWWFKNHLENMTSSMGRMTSPYMKWKIKFMVETTNQN